MRDRALQEQERQAREPETRPEAAAPVAKPAEPNPTPIPPEPIAPVPEPVAAPEPIAHLNLSRSQPQHLWNSLLLYQKRPLLLLLQHPNLTLIDCAFFCHHQFRLISAQRWWDQAFKVRSP